MRLVPLLLVTLVAVSGCGQLAPYRLNIQQGNYVDAEDVDQVDVGMTRSQVRFLLGTPMIADPFNPERWDYVFYFKVGRTRDEITSRLTIWFDGDTVVRVDRPQVDDPMAEVDRS